MHDLLATRMRTRPTHPRRPLPFGHLVTCL